MVLRLICNVHHTAPITRGHTPSHPSNPIQYPGTYANPAQSPSLMANTRQTPDLWRGGCLHRGLHPPPGTYTGPHGCISIAAANLLSRGQTRLNPCPPPDASLAPPALDAATMATPPPLAPSPRCLTGTRCGGQPPSGPRDPQPGRRSWVPRALRQADPHQQKISSFAVVLPIRAMQTWDRSQTRPNCPR